LYPVTPPPHPLTPTPHRSLFNHALQVSPFLYQLRAEGIALPQYYTADVCTPARASLLTGRYALTLGWQYDEHIVSKSGGLGLEETTVAEVRQPPPSPLLSHSAVPHT
jgi:arylsulfatase A-like enzyme